MPVSTPTLAKVVASTLVTALIAIACSNSGEGERCDTRAGNNGNDDCATGLICTKTEELADQTYKIDFMGRCCPPRGTASKSAACGVTQATLDGSPSGTFDSGAGDSAPGDTGASDSSVSDTSAPDSGIPDSATTDAALEAAVVDASAD